MPYSNHFGDIVANLKQRAHALVEDTAKAVQASARQHSRVKTGRMRDGWVVEDVSDTAKAVANDVPYAPTHEYGSVKITAHPMLHPALDEARPCFEQGLKGLLEP